MKHRELARPDATRKLERLRTFSSVSHYDVIMSQKGANFRKIFFGTPEGQPYDNTTL